MSKSGNPPASAQRPADALAQSSTTASIDLAESDLAKVAGGGDVTVNKAKTADKAFQAMDAFIRG